MIILVDMWYRLVCLFVGHRLDEYYSLDEGGYTQVDYCSRCGR